MGCSWQSESIFQRWLKSRGVTLRAGSGLQGLGSFGAGANRGAGSGSSRGRFGAGALVCLPGGKQHGAGEA